jgi:hypothetical protein
MAPYGAKTAISRLSVPSHRLMSSDRHMPLRRTGQTGQSSPSFWRAPRPATRRRVHSTGTRTPRDWIKISVTALPGVVALVALVFAYLSIRATNDQLQMAEQGQITEGITLPSPTSAPPLWRSGLAASMHCSAL